MTPTDQQLADLAQRVTRLEVLVRQLQAAQGDLAERVAALEAPPAKGGT